MGLGKKKDKPQPVTLGEKYRDTISGFEGVATARYEFLYGCVRVCLESEAVKGELKELSFDEQRLVLAANGEKPKATATTGGPFPDPPKRSEP